ncbi:MAG TPA: hypothetical protein PLL71_04190 [Agriterribacter sp.]|nr:hypothetical protein [Agriterribacter sp.]HRQ51567.1 hypothetical protein [Agriterribacter sp.]
MMRGISWGEYFEVLAVLMIMYYCLVLLLYFRSDMMLWAKQGFRKPIQKAHTPPKETISASPAEDAHSPADHNAALFSAVHELMEELKSLFYDASQEPFQKQELLMALQLKLSEYHQLRGTPFQVAVNNHIMQQCLEQCDITVNDTELKQIW